MVLGFAFYGAAHALNIGGSLEKTAKDTTKGAARGAVQNEYNKKLSKEKCEFVGDSTTDYKGCNLDKIISELNAFHNSAESSGFANDVDIIIQAYGSDWTMARKRAEFLRDKVKAQVSYWDYNVKYNKDSSNKVFFQVQVR